jgi:hypothetical protein
MIRARAGFSLSIRLQSCIINKKRIKTSVEGCRMDRGLFRRYMQQYIKEAFENSDGSTAGISRYLWEKTVSSGLFTRHKKEKNEALAEARKAFDEHRHWPVDIVITQLGLDPKELKS